MDSQIDRSILEQTVLENWKRIMRFFESHFDVPEQPVPRIVVISDFSTAETVKNGPSLIISKKMISRGVVNEACVWQSLVIILKMVTACEKCAKDIAIEIGRFITNVDSRKMKAFYKEFVSVTHNGLLHQIALLSGRKGVFEITKEIVAISVQEGKISLEQYRSLLKEEIMRTSPNLTGDEIMLLERVLASQVTTTKAIAEGLARPFKWCTTKINRLLERGIISRTNIIKFSSIGIRKFLIFIGLAKREIFHKIIYLLQNSPFVASISRVLSGPWSFIAQFYVPDNEDNYKAIKKFENIFHQNLGVDTEAISVATQGNTISFRFYSVISHQWAVPWELLEIQLARINTDGFGCSFPNVMETVSDYRREITLHDLNILRLIQQGITTVKNLRTTMKVGQNRLAGRLKWLRQTGILSNLFQIQQIGLPENLIILTEEPTTANSLLAWSQILPHVHHYRDIDNRLITNIQLPRGGSARAALALNRCVQPFYMGITKHISSYPWRVPVENWNPSAKSWSPNIGQLDSWLSLYDELE